jgi:hypothetical protein
MCQANTESLSMPPFIGKTDYDLSVAGQREERPVRSALKAQVADAVHWVAGVLEKDANRKTPILLRMYGVTKEGVAARNSQPSVKEPASSSSSLSSSSSKSTDSVELSFTDKPVIFPSYHERDDSPWLTIPKKKLKRNLLASSAKLNPASWAVTVLSGLVLNEEWRFQGVEHVIQGRRCEISGWFYDNGNTAVITEHYEWLQRVLVPTVLNVVANPEKMKDAANIPAFTDDVPEEVVWKFRWTDNAGRVTGMAMRILAMLVRSNPRLYKFVVQQIAKYASVSADEAFELVVNPDLWIGFHGLARILYHAYRFG